MTILTAMNVRSLVATLLALGALTAAIAAPANAGVPIRKCITHNKEFPTSGFNTDVRLELCIMYDNSERGYWAAATGNWTDGAGVRKFDRFDVKIGVQRHNKTLLKRRYGHAREINAADSGPINDWARYYKSGHGKGGWTADAEVIYDLDADGEGPKKWRMRGTPVIR